MKKKSCERIIIYFAEEFKYIFDIEFKFKCKPCYCLLLSCLTISCQQASLSILNFFLLRQPMEVLSNLKYHMALDRISEKRKKKQSDNVPMNNNQ